MSIFDTAAVSEIIRTLKNNPEMEWTQIYDGQDRPAMIMWWIKSEGKAAATQSYVRFTANGRVAKADGKALGLIQYRDAGKVSRICADIHMRATDERKANLATKPEQFMCNTCEALVDFPGRHCTGTAIADHAVARLTAQLRRDKTMTASSPEPAYQPAADDVLCPSKEDFRSAAIYARAMGSREGRYVTLAAGVTYTPEQEVQITACVIRVFGSWRIVGCCDTNMTECYECNALFQDLNDGSEIVPAPVALEAAAADAAELALNEPWASGYPSASAAPEVKLAPDALRLAWRLVSAQTHLSQDEIKKLGLALDVLSRQPMLAKMLGDILGAE